MAGGDPQPGCCACAYMPSPITPGGYAGPCLSPPLMDTCPPPYAPMTPCDQGECERMCDNTICCRSSGDEWSCSYGLSSFADYAEGAGKTCHVYAGSDCDRCGDTAPTPCCYPDGHCEMKSIEACTASGGVPHFGMMSCDPNLCGDDVRCCASVSPYGCSVIPLGTCLASDGVVAEYYTECSEDTCENACCLPSNGGPSVCIDARVHWCEAQDGVIQWGKRCVDAPCDEPGQCCLCRGQCAEISQRMCIQLNGVWRPDDLSMGIPCNNNAVRCRMHDQGAPISPGCRYAEFAVGHSSTDAIHYRPLSLHKMNPHEYSRLLQSANCLHWLGNVSATRGAWSCGQWDRDRPETNLFFPLKVRIDQATGKGSFWAIYRPVCPEYS